MSRWHAFVLAGLLLGGCDDDPVALSGPSAAFTITPPGGSHDTVFRSDASESSDPEVRDSSTAQGGLFSQRPGSIALPLFDSPRTLVSALVRAYQTRNLELFRSILANDPERNGEFLFWLADGVNQWGLETELRIHQRMFQPEHTLPGELPVPNDLWIQSIDITLTPQADFVERTDLYSNNGGMDGRLDPTVWRAHGALYAADLFVTMLGEVDYQVAGIESFVVIEDVTKSNRETGKFLLFIWEDLGPPGAREVAERTTWSDIKRLYR